jgi:NAD(P)-dependent dehydrogenase (short-subunit alcohol dehydrogenase family)
MTHDFGGTVALVTGGASGIGAATVELLARQGARVVIADLQQEAADALAARLSSEGATVRAVPCDVRDEAAVEAAVRTTVAHFGRLDIALNAAGIGGQELRTAEYAEADWVRVLDVNLTGVWRCLRHQIPAMLSGGGGVIVNVASVAGLIGFPRHPAYAASKHGVVGLTRTAALEYGKKGVRINALCPGFTHTPMVQGMLDAGMPEAELAARVPVGRLAQASEIAATALWLCSPASSYLHGHALAADGGITAA